jgi:hypothetical protein
MFDEMRSEYLARLADNAVTELNKDRRADKVTVLAQALRVLDNLEGGMREVIRDGDVARQDRLRADRIEQMTDAQQRLLKIGPGY